MLKHGIFVKIYLCFWLTIVLVLITQVVLDYIDKSSPIRQLMSLNLEMFGRAAIAFQRSGDSKAVVSLGESYQEKSGVEVCLLDEQGKRLDGVPTPPMASLLAAKTLQSGKTEYGSSPDKALMALALVAPGGTKYVVLGSHKKGLLMPVVGNPRPALRISIILAVSGLLCYILARYLVCPLISLRNATRRFAAGELSVRIGRRAGFWRDETTDLANDFDLMAERIESLMKLQCQLVGDISHELRSPLARLNVALDLAWKLTSSEAEHALSRIEEEAQELNVLIDELLTLTRLESGGVYTKMAAVDLAELVRDVVQSGDFEAQGSNRGVKLIECDACTVEGNGELLRRAIENIVRNAIRYTSEHTDVEISVRRLPMVAQIIVRDRGPGVPESELGNIFQPFFRISEDRDRQSGGTGLGLAISNRAVRLHEGIISAENVSEGGLSVKMTIPLHQAGNLCPSAAVKEGHRN
jgi:signal transduction histidine kinase